MAAALQLAARRQRHWWECGARRPFSGHAAGSPQPGGLVICRLRSHAEAEAPLQLLPGVL